MAQVIYYASPGCAGGGLQVKTDEHKATIRLSVGLDRTLSLEVSIDVDRRTYFQLRKIEECIAETQQTKDGIPEEIYFRQEADES